MRGRATFLRIGSILAGGALVLLPHAAYACERCFGAGVDSPTTHGIGMAMLSLMAVTGVVWGGIGAFFVNMRRRIKLLEPGDHVVTEQGWILPSPEASHD